MVYTWKNFMFKPPEYKYVSLKRLLKGGLPLSQLHRYTGIGLL